MGRGTTRVAHIGRRLRHLLHRLWNLLIRIATGNRDKEIGSVAVWNSRHLHAGGAADKLGWLGDIIETHEPGIIALLEIDGNMIDARSMRRWGHNRGYEMRMLVGWRAGSRARRRGRAVTNKEMAAAARHDVHAGVHNSTSMK